MTTTVRGPGGGTAARGQLQGTRLDDLDERLLTPQDLSEMLRVPIHTLYRWRAQGSGPVGYRVGKHVRYRRSAVEAWFEGMADDRS